MLNAETSNARILLVEANLVTEVEQLVVEAQPVLNEDVIPVLSEDIRPIRRKSAGFALVALTMAVVIVGLVVGLHIVIGKK
jgi:hypothetical protein